jgi:DNA-binding response OmpR family regulator
MANVLVVEDTPELRTLLEVRLSHSGHRVISAASGEEALGLLALKGPPDVAVLDVVMPGMTGLELHARLREDPAYASTPVIFLSSRVDPDDVSVGRSLGAVYLTKPVVFSALTAAIERVLKPVAAKDAGW